MPSPPTPISGVARPCIVAAGSDVVVVAIVVVVAVSLLLVLGRVGHAVLRRVSPSVTTGVLQLLAFAVVMETALVTLGKITGIRSGSI